MRLNIRLQIQVNPGICCVSVSGVSSDECSSFFIAWDPPEYGSCIFKCSKQSLGRLKWSQPEFSNKKMETFST